jgi:cobalt/nickel transport protein
MKKLKICLVSGLLILILDISAYAHFGMMIPSDSMIMQGENRAINMTISFSHPFEGQGMIMERPERLEVVVNGKATDLIPSLKETRFMGRRAWNMGYKVTRPGVYKFLVEPKPYWEPTEDCFIIHYTKTIIAAFGNEEGWDEPLGLKTEIIPLTRPFGLYAGNVFQGIVTIDGIPAPYAEVEVEYYNEESRISAPNDYFVTQAVKADKNGVFTYAAPGAGWWGFAALSTSDNKITYQDEEKDVELGAVLWVEFMEWNYDGPIPKSMDVMR